MTHNPACKVVFFDISSKRKEEKIHFKHVQERFPFMEAEVNEKEFHLCEAIPQLIRYRQTASYFDHDILLSEARDAFMPSRLPTVIVQFSILISKLAACN